MKKGYMWFLFLIIFIIGAKPAIAITWGVPDVDDIYQNVGMVGISVWDGQKWEPSTICSGTLIHPSAVITAGHCIDYVNMLEYDNGPENVLVEVFFGWDQTGSTPTGGSWAEQYIIHPNYYWGPV